MIRVEDINEEKYHINPKLVVYVKERIHQGRHMYKIMLVNGEAIMTTNEEGAKCIIASIKCKKPACKDV